jgi:hypothetical protein
MRPAGGGGLSAAIQQNFARRFRTTLGPNGPGDISLNLAEQFVGSDAWLCRTPSSIQLVIRRRHKPRFLWERSTGAGANVPAFEHQPGNQSL